MGGFASFIGGLGDAAQKYGAEVRPILERQREGFAAMISKAAEQENNPDYRNTLMKLSADALSGQPIHKILPAFQKHLQNVQADHEAAAQLAQSMGGAPPPTTPASVAGATPGTGRVASQPTTSPVSPGAQQGATIGGNGDPMPGMMGVQQMQPQANLMANPMANLIGQAPPQAATPQSSDPRALRQAILDKYNTRMMQSTPHAQPFVQAEMQGELAALQPFEDQARKMQQLGDLQNTPSYKALTPIQQSSYEAQARGFTPPSMLGMGSMIAPHHESYMAKDILRMYPEEAARAGITADTQGPVLVSYTMADPSHPFAIGGKPVRNQQIPGVDAEGGWSPYYANPYGTGSVADQAPDGVRPVVQSDLTNHSISLPNAHTAFISAAKAALGRPPVENGGVAANLMENLHSNSSTQTPSGTVTSSASRKVLPGGGGTAPNPKSFSSRPGEGALLPLPAAPSLGAPLPHPGTPTLGYRERAALDKEIGQFGKPYEQMYAGAQAQLDKILEARQMVQGGAVQQALGIPKVLSALVSGAGSGVRITQAELNSVAHARGLGGDFEGFFRRIAGQGTLTSQQKQQLDSALNDVQNLVLSRKHIAEQAHVNMRSANSREDILKADKEAMQALSGSGAVDPQIKSYADKYFGGDVAKAQAAIQSQGGK